jgi:cytochrome c
MFRKLGIILPVFLAFLIAASAVRAGEYGTREEAQAMVERAVKFFAEQGKDRAFSAFTEGTDGFKDRDLYVFVYDRTGVAVAHGGSKALVGKSLIELRDVDGKDIVREVVSVPSAGWVHYKWPNPVTKAITEKSAYVVRSGDYSFGVGAYTKP